MVEGRPLEVFTSDLRMSLRAMATDPRLPAISIALAALGYLTSVFPEAIAPIATLLALPVSIFNVGYVGAERIWFARLFNGESLDGRGIWKWSWHFFSRYLLLGLLVLAILSPLIIIYLIEVFDLIGDTVRETRRGTTEISDRDLEEALLTPTNIVLSVVLMFLIDILLTFTTAALAFTTHRPLEAMKLNLRLIRKELPTSLLYVLIPPLAIVLSWRVTTPGAFGPAVYLGGGLLAVSFNLLMKGATAAFYLRKVDSLST